MYISNNAQLFMEVKPSQLVTSAQLVANGCIVHKDGIAMAKHCIATMKLDIDDIWGYEVIITIPTDGTSVKFEWMGGESIEVGTDIASIIANFEI